jgi:fucose permease
MEGERAVWVGCGVAVGATLVLTTAAAALESTVNSPGDRTVAAPVLWAFGGGLGLCIGAFVTAWLTRRVGPGVLAACVGAIPFLILVIIAYNDDSLRFEDQLVGSLVIVVLPGLVAAVLCAIAGAWAGRILGRQSSPARKSVAT